MGDPFGEGTKAAGFEKSVEVCHPDLVNGVLGQ
jgi:hypothetical protein